MKVPQFVFAALTALLLAMTLPSAASETRDPSEFFFQDSFNDLSEEAELAQKEGKIGVLVVFETDDCPWCDHWHVGHDNKLVPLWKQNRSKHGNRK